MFVTDSNLEVVELLFYRQTLHGTPGGISGNLQQIQNRSQHLPGPMQAIIIIMIIFLSYRKNCFHIFDILVCLKQDVKSEMNSMMNPRATGPEGSLTGVQGND